jgi:predicted nucleic acid-binding protein
MKLFIDTDVILDVLLERQEFLPHSREILARAERNRIRGYTSTLILANCYYILSSGGQGRMAAAAISRLRSILEVLPFTDREIGESLNSSFRDFEDGVQFFIALNNGLDMIITRNTSDFRDSSIAVLSPAEFLAR